jgi:hypothetical protein
LFEIATDSPGFTVDAPVDALGRDLELPNFLEPRRKEIGGVLPALEKGGVVTNSAVALCGRKGKEAPPITVRHCG